jgi:hypothetical protein
MPDVIVNATAGADMALRVGEASGDPFAETTALRSDRAYAFVRLAGDSFPSSGTRSPVVHRRPHEALLSSHREGV